MTRSTRSRLMPTKMKIEQLEDRAVPAIVFTENFDSTAVGSLPAGWTGTIVSGVGSNWVVDATNAPTPVFDTGTRSVWIDDQATLTEKVLVSPTINIPNVVGTQIRFRHNYITENGWDGGVLEISISGGAYQNITVGGAIVTGGYPRALNNGGTALGTSFAWTGTSGGWVTVLANLPAAAQGQPVRFRWRSVSDGSVGGTGWRVDSVQVGTPNTTLVSGDGQSVRTGRQFAAPLQAQVLSEFGAAPIPNVTLTFSAPASGATATFPNGNTAVTNASGIASMVVGANLVSGSYAVTINGTTISYDLTNLPNPAPVGVTAGGPYVGVDGDTMVFEAAATDPENEPLSYSWDLNGDGVFNDALGQRLILTPLQLASLNIRTGFSTADVRVRVSDGFTTVESPATSLVVNQFVAPAPPTPIGPFVPVGAAAATQLTAIAAGPGGGPHVRVYNNDGSERFAFFAYSTAFTGGISTATGDVTGDGIEDVITGAGFGGGPHVKVYDGATGAELRSFFAFDPLFRNGLSIGAGDVNGDGHADIVIGAGPGGGPHVKVFDGATGNELRSFFAFNAAFRGGVSVAAGDVTGDGAADVIVGAGSNGGPNVKVYDGGSMASISDFFAFGNSFTGGVTVAAGDVNRDGKAELLVGQASGGNTVKMFSGATGSEMLTYSMTGANGVRVALSDVTGDGLLDPIVASAPGTGSLLRVLRTDGTVFRELSPFGGFGGGVFVG